MLVNPENLFKCYQEIKDSIQSGDKTSLLILVAPDCDALCACQILTNLLRSDHVPYTVQPMSSYELLKQNKAKWVQNEVILFLINCGGVININELVIEENAEVEGVEAPDVYIADSRRPYHVMNILSDNVHLLDCDSEVNPSKFPFNTNKTDLMANEIIQKSDFFLHFDEEGGGDGGRKRKRAEEERLEYFILDEASKYYAEQYFGASSGNLMMELSQQLNRENIYHLWLAVVGTTDQYIHEKIGKEAYGARVSVYQSEVNAKFRNPDDSEMERDEVQSVNDFIFVLHRHWSLIEAMTNSHYVAAQLRLWTPNGHKKLLGLIAKMGYPLKDVNQKYDCMPIEIKRSLVDKITKYAIEFDLPDVIFDSFTLLRKNRSPAHLSASDVVYSTTALLEASFSEEESDSGEIYSGQSGFERSFNKAYDSLNYFHSGNAGKQEALIKEGFTQAKMMAKLIQTRGISLIANKRIFNEGNFRYAIIKNSAESEAFLRPLALLRLALFIIAASKREATLRRRQKKGSLVKPFLLCSLNERKRMYVAVGVPGVSSSGIKQRSHFGSLFRLVSRKVNANMQLDISFDASAIEIGQEDITRFLDHLHLQFVRE